MQYLPAGFFEDEKAREYVSKYNIPFEVALFIVGLEEESASEAEKEQKRLQLINQLKTNPLTVLRETVVHQSTELATKIIYILNKI